MQPDETKTLYDDCMDTADSYYEAGLNAGNTERASRLFTASYELVQLAKSLK